MPRSHKVRQYLQEFPNLSPQQKRIHFRITLNHLLKLLIHNSRSKPRGNRRKRTK